MFNNQRPDWKISEGKYAEWIEEELSFSTIWKGRQGMVEPLDGLVRKRPLHTKRELLQ